MEEKKKPPMTIKEMKEKKTELEPGELTYVLEGSKEVESGVAPKKKVVITKSILQIVAPFVLCFLLVMVMVSITFASKAQVLTLQEEVGTLQAQVQEVQTELTNAKQTLEILVQKVQNN